MSIPADQPVPGYRIVRLLGRGGMATVYLAVQESLGRDVALKLLAPELADDPIAAERFIREARTAAHLQHRHIVGVHDVGKHEGQPYLSMEYMPRDSIAGGAMPPAEALQVIREIALALDHAHQQGVVHRDVKPENILRRNDGSCALSDFGIARTTEPGLSLTADGMTVGTPHYMSPEQVQGQPLDGRSDLYSLGVVLYQLLTGELPYSGTDGWNIGMQHISAPRPSLPPPLQRFQPLVDALMAKDPADRPQSGADVARRIDDTLAAMTPSRPTSATPTPAASPSSVPASPAPARRNLAFVAIAALALLSAVAWYLSQRAQPAATPLQDTAAVAQAQRSIAVLPLVNLSGNPDNEYFSDGLAETLLDMLAQVPDLTVIARTSSFAFKGKPDDVRKIGKALDTTHLLEGSVQQSGQRLRITVQLIRTSDGAHLWSQRYDRKMADVFDVQDEVAAEIVKAMELALPAATAGPMRAGRTTNLAAYQEYLRGTARLPLRTVEDLQAAIVHFERAIELDPGYAMAYAVCANTYTMLNAMARLSPAQATRREQYIRKALELDPNSGEAHIGRAAMLRRSDPVAAERDFKRGLALAPSYTTGYAWYAGWLAGFLGRPTDAIPLLQRAIVIDPLDPSLRLSLAQMLLALGRIEEAEAIGNTLVANHPKFPHGFNLQASLRRARGDLVGELRFLQRLVDADPLSASAKLARCDTMARAGLLELARSCPREFSKLGGAAHAIPEMEWVAAVWAGDWNALPTAQARMDNPDTIIRSYTARLNGKPTEALAIYRQAWPEWFKDPIGNPNLDNEHQFIDVAYALIATGDTERAQRVLQIGLDMAAKRHPGSGIGGGKGWTEVLGLALLGQNRKACGSMAAAADVGMYEMHMELAVEPLLADFRADPCFAPAYARVQALAQSQIAAAEKAGLL
ncbi:MAG: hypothetical protein A3E01_08800 [Gammaproteobacteria bacterium RIFCSPHIGHO2_12_FULL_63_22]|nr:MAG: hypothetical protein A3E01_08800 [Gammaproteobacteria bacterium RIFCSPHIGHO2_12_FULL_63_22]